MTEYILSAMVKLDAESADDAYDKLYGILCATGDVGFSINEYLVSGDKPTWVHKDSD